MKVQFRIMTAVGFSLLMSGAAFAQNAQDTGRVLDAKQVAEEVAAKKAVEVGNKLCPVSGEKVPPCR